MAVQRRRDVIHHVFHQECENFMTLRRNILRLYRLSTIILELLRSSWVFDNQRSTCEAEVKSLQFVIVKTTLEL